MVGLVWGSGDGDGDGDGGWEVGVAVVDAQQHCGRSCLIKTSCVAPFWGTDDGNRTIANLETNRSLSRRRVGGWLGVGEWGLWFRFRVSGEVVLVMGCVWSWGVVLAGFCW